MPNPSTRSNAEPRLYENTFVPVNSDYDRVNVWATVAEPSKQYQHISSKFDGQTRYFEIDITPKLETY